MNTPHYKKGSSCPALGAGVLRCYNMRFCPYAQRACITLAAKKLKYEIVNINLKNRPDWYYEKNALGKVPTLEQDGKLLPESLVICDYLDEAYPSPPLYPSDPWKKGQDKVWIELFGKVSSALLKTIYQWGDESNLVEDAQTGLKAFEEELAKRNTKYFFGQTPGMLDYMMWPAMERLPVAQIFNDELASTISATQYPKLFSWMDNMKKLPEIQETYLPPEVHQKYVLSGRSGPPDYDMLVA